MTDVQKRLEAKADEFVALRQQLRQLTGEESRVAALRADAETALGGAELLRAQDKLRQAAALEVTATGKLAERTRAHALAAAGLLEKSARIASVTLHYRDAADDFGRAAAAVAPFDRHEQWRLTTERAAMLRSQGEEFGDRAALADAVEGSEAALALVVRAERPADWARSRHALGRALRSTGDVEWDTIWLERSVAAFEAALEERTREAAPQEWADTQNNLGLALWMLGERRDDKAALERGIAALRSVLDIWTRADAPLAWARAQDTLGMLLVTLGRRETETGRLLEGLRATR